MDDISIRVGVTGAQDLDKLANVIEKLTGTLNAGAGAGKSLEELRKILVGLKGKGSALEELATAAKGFTDATAEMRKGIGDNFKSLERLLKSEFKQLTTVMQQGGVAGGKAFTDGVVDSVTKGTSEATAAISKSGKTLAAKARAEATKAYEAMVGGDANAKVKPAGMSALFQMREAGAQISAYHKNLLDAWVQSSNQTYAAIRSNVAAEQKKLTENQGFKVKSASKMSIDDTRALLGMPSTAEMKSFTAQLKAQLQQQVKEISDIYAQAKKQVAFAQSAPSGSFSRLRDRATTIIPNSYGSEDLQAIRDAAVPPKTPKTPKLGEAAQGMREVTKAGNDMHSMARGLASGFNLLWLTWGNLVPLFIGAGISNAFIQTTKTGMQVAHTMEVIGVLGGNTATEMGALTQELDRLGNVGPHGPIEIADAMKVLSLAGLKANEILAVTQDVLNFSIAGTTDLKTAADALVSISTAFGMGAEGFGRVSDVVSKAAAESKSSVESFANAMKTASVIGKQYGVTLEDTATGIAALSQLGIEGTAAGTALRNMYADLSGRSMQVAKVLRAQGIEMRDLTNGGFKPMLEVVAELDTKLSKMTAIGQKNFLQALLSERGAKGMIEYLALIRTNAKDTSSTFRNALEEMRAKIDESYGFAAVSAAKLNQTVQSSFQGVGATLKTTFNEVYREIEPQLYLIALNLREAFASEGFKSALSTLTNLIAKFATVLTENAHALGIVAASAAGLKLAQMALISTSSALTRLMAIGTAAKVADTLATETNTAATIANNAAKVGFAATALKWLGRANIVLGVVTTAWMAYEFFMGKSSDSEAEASRRYNDGLAKSLSDQAEKLERVNLLRAQGLSLADAEARINGEETKRAIAKGSNASQLQEQAAKAKKAYDDLLEQSRAGKLGAVEAARLPTLRNASIKAAVAAANATIELQDQQQLIDKNTQRYIQASRQTESINLAERKRAMEALQVFGNLDYQQGEDKNGNSLKAVSAVKQNLMKETEEANRNELAAIKAHYDTKQRLLKADADAAIISQGEFMMREIALTEEGEAKQLEALKLGSEKYFQAYEAQSQALLDKQVKWKALNGNATKDQIEKEAEDTQTALDNLTREYTTTITGMAQQGVQIKFTAIERLQLSAKKAVGEINALQKSFKDFWAAEENSAAAKSRAAALEDQLRFASPEQIAYLQAYSQEYERLQSKIESVDTEYSRLNKELEAVIVNQMIKGTLTNEDSIALTTLAEKVAIYRQQLEKLREAQGAGSGKAGNDALTKYGKEEAKRLQDGVSDAIVTGLFEGGKAGRKKLRDLVVNELKKPIVLMIQAGVNLMMSGAQGLLATFTGGGSGSGGTSAVSSGMNLLSGAKNLSTFGGQFLNGATAWGPGGSVSGVLSTGISNPGTYSMGEMAGAAAPYLAGGFAAYGMGQKYGAVGGTLGGMGVGALSAGTASAMAGGSFMSGAGALMSNPWGWAVMAALAILGSDDSGTIHAGGGSQYDTALDELKTSTSGGMFRTNFGGVDESAGTIEFTSNLAKGVGNGLAGIAKTFGQEAGFEIATAFADDTSKDGAWGALRISQGGKDLVNWADTQTSKWAPKEFANGEKGQKEYLNAVAKDTLQVLKNMDLPKWADDMLDSLGDAPSMEDLGKVAGYIQGVQGAFKNLGEYLPSFANLSGEAATQLLTLSGGIDNLVQGAGYFYANFYTDTERYTTSLGQLNTAFKDAGLTLPKTKEEYRKLVEAQDLNTEAGRKNYAMLIQFAPAYNEITEAGEQAKTTIENLLSSVGITTSELADTIRDGLLGRISGAEAGGKVADIITGGIYNALAQGAAQQITNILTQGIITPVVQAAVAGQSITGLVSSAAIDAVITQARAAMTAISQVLNDPAIQAMLTDIGTSVAGLFSGFQAPTLPSYVPTVFEDTTDAADAAKDAAQEAFEMLQKAVNAQRELAQEQLDALIKVRDIARAASNDLFGFKGNAGMGLAQAQAFVSNAAQNAQMTGYMPDADMLEEAVAVLKDQLTANKFKTLQEFTLAKSLAAADLDAIADAADPQITALEAQLESLNAILETAQAQLDALNGVNTSVLSVAEALANFQAALSAAGGGTSAGGGGFGGVQTSAQMFKNMTTKDMFGGVHAATVSGSGSAWNYRSQSGSDVSTLSGGVWTPQSYASKNPDIRAYFDANQDAIKQYNQPTNFNDYLAWHFATYGISEGRKFATGGVHSGGWAMVGEQGPELLQMPAGRVYNNGQTQDILAGDSAAAAEVAALRQEIEEMRAEIRTTAVNTGKTQRLLDRITRNGESMQVTVVT